ncbi:MAG: hypothetical protein JNL74_20545 [Fibrobacteres bacterium]|nr:hypothetical protein [Fibrobacterota bacterium]
MQELTIKDIAEQRLCEADHSDSFDCVDCPSYVSCELVPFELSSIPDNEHPLT